MFEVPDRFDLYDLFCGLATTNPEFELVKQEYGTIKQLSSNRITAVLLFQLLAGSLISLISLTVTNPILNSPSFIVCLLLIILGMYGYIGYLDIFSPKTLVSYYLHQLYPDRKFDLTQQYFWIREFIIHSGHSVYEVIHRYYTSIECLEDNLEYAQSQIDRKYRNIIATDLSLLVYYQNFLSQQLSISINTTTLGLDLLNSFVVLDNDLVSSLAVYFSVEESNILHQLELELNKWLLKFNFLQSYCSYISIC